MDHEDRSGAGSFQLGPLAAAGLIAATGPDRPSAWLTYIATTDLPATLDATVAAGGSVLQPATPIGARGHAAVIADAEGAPLGLWQKGSFAGAQVMHEPGAICWTDYVCRAPDTATTFYGSVFGWTTRTNRHPQADEYRDWLLTTREVAGLHVDYGYPVDTPAQWRITFDVEECAATVDRCSALGGRLAFGPTDIGPGTYAQLIDPLGASFGVMALIPELRRLPR